MGDVISYIFCVSPGDESAKSAQADRAKHPDELKKAASNEFSIDYEHYLAHQVLPPIERLCDPIEGTDRARLAECLGELTCRSAARLTDRREGLDPGRYRVSGGVEAGSALTTLDSQVSDAERFKNSEPFLVRCRGCQGQMSFSPIWEREVSCTLPHIIGRFHPIHAYSRRSCNPLALFVRRATTDSGKPVCRRSLRCKYGRVSGGITRGGRFATMRRVDTGRVR